MKIEYRTPFERLEDQLVMLLDFFEGKQVELGKPSYNAWVSHIHLIIEDIHHLRSNLDS